ncbi:MAG: class I SAM-dependent methyltransferase [Patescibacteria group bacterium]
MPENDPQKTVKKVKDDYNSIAQEWDRSRSRPSQLKLKLTDEIEAGAKVLDVGCGNALMLPFVLEKGAFYYGLDVAENLIEIARGRYAKEIKEGKASLAVGEASKLPFADAEFDFVISFAVLHHLPSGEIRKKFFDEIRRVLRPRGKAKIIVWNLFNDWARNRFDIESQLNGKTSGDVVIPWKGTHGTVVNRYMHQFSKEELYDLAESSGFSDVRIGYFNRAGEKVENGEEMVLEMER